MKCLLARPDRGAMRPSGCKKKKKNGISGVSTVRNNKRKKKSSKSFRTRRGVGAKEPCKTRTGREKREIWGISKKKRFSKVDDIQVPAGTAMAISVSAKPFP